MAELCAWKNVIEGAGGDVCMEEYGRRLLAEMCTWKNMAKGCWLRCVHGRIWKTVVG
jgi:hypothetical protein